MAEKKFFVDINLQGSALTNAKIGTNTGIGSTEGAFGYDSAAHRLQYFDGTATKDVANLSDIAAVTGGLIFQGGYDPTTNTPDITDGSALKGFFWAATAAGTFLGESVQVGDSIVAKVDNAGATLSDWLILQGNIVIATDSVDGISRLATQTEANDGTEGGAVVITPATLQGKIDAQITPEINSKLPLAGGTMSGNIDMGGNQIQNAQLVNTDALYTEYILVNGGIEANSIGTENNTAPLSVRSNLDLNSVAGQMKIINSPTPTDAGDAANKTYVDGVGATAESNANDYTSSVITTEITNRTNAIKALSFTGTIQGTGSGTSGWTYDGVSEYYTYVNHNLNNKWNVVTTTIGENTVEFNVQMDGLNAVLLRTNVEPVENTIVSIVNAGGNL